MTLDEIRKLCEAATAGPWVHRFGDYGNNHGVFFGKEWQQNIALFVVVAGRGNGGSVEEHANAAFIAASRDLMPALLAVASAAAALLAEEGVREELSCHVAAQILEKALAALEAP